MAQSQPAESQETRGEMATIFEWREKTGSNIPANKLRVWVEDCKRRALHTIKTAKGKGSKDQIAYARGMLTAVIRIEKTLDGYAASEIAKELAARPAKKDHYFQWKDEGIF